MIKTLGADQIDLLLRHHAAQQTRSFYYLWEQVQVGLGLVLGICLYFATQKRLLSLVLCGIMLGVVMFQFFAITPELAYRGREADFNQMQAPSATVRLLLLYQLLVVSEGMKVIVGGLLASYLFSFRTSRRKGHRHEESELDSSLTSAG